MVADIAQKLLDEQILGRKFHIEKAHPTETARWRSSFNWMQLNAVLASHRPELPHLRIVRGGQLVPPESYSHVQVGRKTATWHQLDVDGLNKQLRTGATLALDYLDELDPSVGDLASDVERVLCTPVKVNAYASWQPVEGLSAHWDDHDVLVLQVEGSKRWTIYGVGRPSPLYRDVEPNLDMPRSPLTEFDLHEGDALYLPRGWWHVARATDGPSLHLTVSFWPTTVADFLHWTVDNLCAHEVVRQDLAGFTTTGDQKKWLLAKVNELFAESLTDPQVVDQMREAERSKVRPRKGLALPYAALSSSGSIPLTARLKLLAPLARLEVDQDAVTLVCGGAQLRYRRAAEPLFRLLLSGEESTIESLSKRANLSAVAVQGIAHQLAHAGLLSLR